ncbi:hypothetical protein VTI74DRAFT_10697 [Chaetomium olivicolor]
MLEMPEDMRSPSRGKVKGVVNYPPFETLDEPALREVRRFQVRPFGSIQETGKRIPYNSGKKDFFSKTGREAFDVFYYDFKVPGDDTPYTVMWDYSVGLVRMTPFFKCRGYSKTTPAKMLNQNPGLKDITHSITGGAIKAQGYWMPFSCAKAICATFCYKIAGALIPLFGPRFPSECIPENTSGYGRMVIDPGIVAQARRDAAAMFRAPPDMPSPRPSRSLSPLPSQRSTRMVPEQHGYYSDYDRRVLLSPYGDDTDVDCTPVPERYSRPRFPNVSPLRIPAKPPLAPASVPTPVPSPGWMAVNQHTHQPRPTTSHNHRVVSSLNEELLGLNVSATANPWLSAVPRSPTPSIGSTGRWHAFYPRPHHYQTSPSSTGFPEPPITLPPLRLNNKRRFDEVDPDTPGKNNDGDAVEGDDAYDAGSSQGGSSTPSSPVEGPMPAPPPTPASVASKTTIPSASHSELEDAGVATPSNADADGANKTPTPHPAAEHDAALMLVTMRSSSSNSSEEDNNRNSSSSNSGGGASNRSDKESPPEGTGTGSEKTEDSIRVVSRCEPAHTRSSMMLLTSSGNDGRRTWPNTRAKRRRTAGC